MTKKQIRTDIEKDWIEDMEGLTKGEAIEYLECLPEGVVLDVDYRYNEKCGVLFILREETDEEETAREADEKERQENYERALQIKRDREATQRALTYASCKVLSEYNEKHKDNPKVGDMCNLYKMILDLEIKGKSVTILRECLDALERER